MNSIQKFIKEHKDLFLFFAFIVSIIIYGYSLNRPATQNQINKDISWINSFIDNIHTKQTVLQHNFNIDTAMQENIIPLTSGFMISKNSNVDDHFISLSNTHIFMQNKNNIQSLNITSMSKNVCQNFVTQLKNKYNVSLNNTDAKSSNCSSFGNYLTIVI
jgi:hypothetical protein